VENVVFAWVARTWYNSAVTAFTRTPAARPRTASAKENQSMAKKTVKKAGKKAAGKPAMKKAAKAAPKKAPAKKAPAKKAVKAAANPSMVTTGSGPSPAEIGADLVAMFNRGELSAIEAKWHSPSLVSVEGVGVAMAWSGKKAVQEKNEGWMATHRLHGASAEGPYIGASGFAVKFSMDVEDTSNGSRVLMDEVGVYTVQNGKIVREEFMYGSVCPVTPSQGSPNGTAGT
jgi:hypothetical protein